MSRPIKNCDFPDRFLYVYQRVVSNTWLAETSPFYWQRLLHVAPLIVAPNGPRFQIGGKLAVVAIIHQSLEQRLVSKVEVFNFQTNPDAPCMEYLTTFGSFLG